MSRLKTLLTSSSGRTSTGSKLPTQCIYQDYRDIKPEHWPWKHFKPSEIACQQISEKGYCGCGGSILINFKAMDKLEAFREHVGVPVRVNSPFRCHTHNQNVGGSPNSQHRHGIAFDIRITSKLTREKIHWSAKAVGFKAFGDYNTFVHVDDRDTPAYWDHRT